MQNESQNELLWKKVLSELQLEVSPAVFNTLFKQTQLKDIASDVATIAVISPMIQRMIETRYYTLLKKTIDKYTQGNTSLLFTVDSKLKRIAPQAHKEEIGPLFQQDVEPSSFALLLQRNKIKPESTLENYAVSGTNQLAYAAATHVAQNPGISYNPLFIYGGVGVGKTHLMQGIGIALLKKDPNYRIVYCNSEDFTNEIIEAIRNKTTTQFRNKYRKAQLLCIDDIQFIAGKDTVQEEFFHTFNAIIQERGQIILTSDKPPTEIPRLEARIRSRLEGGLIIDISPPDFELRVAILLIKAKQRNVELPVELAKIIANSISDTRGLEGALVRVSTEATLRGIPLTEELVYRVLGKQPHVGLSEAEGGRQASKDEFIESVCTYYNLKVTQIKGKKRDASIALPRQILMYLLRTELNVGLTEIGFLIGGRDHTTVIHAVDKISTLVKSNDRIREDIMGIKKLIYEP